MTPEEEEAAYVQWRIEVETRRAAVRKERQQAREEAAKAATDSVVARPQPVEVSSYPGKYGAPDRPAFVIPTKEEVASYKPPAAPVDDKREQNRSLANLPPTRDEAATAATTRADVNNLAIDLALRNKDNLVGSNLTKEQEAIRKQAIVDVRDARQSRAVNRQVQGAEYANFANDMPFIGTQQIDSYSRDRVKNGITRVQEQLKGVAAGEVGSEKYKQLTQVLATLQNADAQMEAKKLDTIDLRYDPDYNTAVGTLTLPGTWDYFSDVARRPKAPGLSSKELEEGGFVTQEDIIPALGANVSQFRPPEMLDNLATVGRVLSVPENAILRGVDALMPSDLPRGVAKYQPNIIDPEGKATKSDLKQTTAAGDELGFLANTSRDASRGRGFGTVMAGTPVYTEFATEVARALGADENAEAIGNTAALTAGLATSIAMPSTVDAVVLAAKAGKALPSAGRAAATMESLYAKAAKNATVARLTQAPPITQAQVDEALSVLEEAKGDIAKVPVGDKRVLLEAPAEMFKNIDAEVPPAASKLRVRQQLLGKNASSGLVPKADGTYASPELERLAAEIKAEADSLQINLDADVASRRTAIVEQDVNNAAAATTEFMENQAKMDEALSKIASYEKQIADIDSKMVATKNADSVANKKALDAIRAELVAKRNAEVKAAVEMAQKEPKNNIDNLTAVEAFLEDQIKSADSAASIAARRAESASKRVLEERVLLKDDTMLRNDLAEVNMEINVLTKKVKEMTAKLPTAKGNAKKTLETWRNKHAADLMQLAVRREKITGELAKINTVQENIAALEEEARIAKIEAKQARAAANSDEVTKLRTGLAQVKEAKKVAREKVRVAGTEARETYFKNEPPLPKTAPKVSDEAAKLASEKATLVAEKAKLQEVNKQLAAARKTIGVNETNATKAALVKLQNDQLNLQGVITRKTAAAAEVARAATRKNPNLADIKDTSALSLEKRVARWFSILGLKRGGRIDGARLDALSDNKMQNLMTARAIRKEIKALPKDTPIAKVPEELMKKLIPAHAVGMANEFYLERLYGNKQYKNVFDETRNRYLFATSQPFSVDDVRRIAVENEVPIPTDDQMLHAALDTIMSVRQGSADLSKAKLPIVTQTLRDAISSEGYVRRGFDYPWLSEKVAVNILQSSKTSGLGRAGGWGETLVVDLVNAASNTPTSSVYDLQAIYRAVSSGSEHRLLALGFTPEQIKLIAAFEPKPTPLEIDRYAYMTNDLEIAVKNAVSPIISKDWALAAAEQLLPNGSPAMNWAIGADINARKLVYAEALLRGATPVEAITKTESFAAMTPRFADSTNPSAILFTPMINYGFGMYSRLRVAANFASNNAAPASRLGKAYVYKKVIDANGEKENYGNLASYGWMVDYNDKSQLLLLPPTVYDIDTIIRTTSAFAAGASGLLQGGAENAAKEYRKTKNSSTYDISPSASTQAAAAFMLAADSVGHARSAAMLLGMRPVDADPVFRTMASDPTLARDVPFEPAIVLPDPNAKDVFIAYTPGPFTGAVIDALAFVADVNDTAWVLAALDTMITGELDVSSYLPNDPSVSKRAVILLGATILPNQMLRMPDRQRKEVMDRYLQLMKDTDVQLTNAEIELIERNVLNQSYNKK